ncbi:MAG: 30S ribosomal protein S1 [Flavobacteriales bacterium]|nr:30S ribosomal protein S1 [Flavobacteriales bacterium]
MIDENNLNPEEGNEVTSEGNVESTEEVVVATDKATDETTEESSTQEEVTEEEKSPHDDFDWTNTQKHELPYSEQEINDYLDQYEKTLSSVAEGEIVTGKVTAVSESDILLDINYKSDGLVSLSEFRDLPDLKAGDDVKVYVEQLENDKGQLQLSRRKAKLLNAWENLVDSYQNGTIIKGTVISKTKGGLIVDAGGLETFLPGSQIDIKPIIDYDSYVGKTMEFKVVKINETIKNAVVSHKALIESDLAEQREAIISSLEKGQVLEGVVKNITDFGAFMDLGGVDGLLYITDISWGRINHPNEILELNQKINVVVLDFDENKKRISLGLKQLQPHPWDVLPEDIAEGSTVKGRIVNIEDYGAFLEITPGVEGLIHVSEVTWSNQPINAKDYFSIGQEYEAKIVTIDREERKMSLSLKQLMTDPWSDISDRFPEDSRHTGEVKNLTPYGVFVELEDGIGGMVHISDLSWTKRFSHPSEFTKVGNEIEVVILDIDKESRKLSLGHKQIEENPWNTFENVFPVGSYHEATIVRKDDKGATVQLPYGLEAFAPARHIRKEDGTYAEVEENLTFKVIEFNRDDKRILVSHLRYLEDIQREADESVRKEKRTERRSTERMVKKQQSNVRRSTLGELDVFSQLKEQFTAGAGETKKEEKVEEVKEEAAAPVEEKTSSPEVAETTTEEVEVPKVEEDVKEEVTESSIDEVAEEVAEEEVTEEVAEEEATEEVAEEVAETPEIEASEAEEVTVEETAETVVEESTAEDTSEAVEENAGVIDDLRKIEGIGPKISQILGEAGINSFEQLAGSDVEHLREVLLTAGSRYKMFDPTTWPEQAKLAAQGDWEALDKLQDELDGGKR